MDVFKGIRRQAEEMFAEKEQVFQQYMHRGLCKIPCKNCGSYYFRIFDKSGAKAARRRRKTSALRLLQFGRGKIACGFYIGKGKTESRRIFEKLRQTARLLYYQRRSDKRLRVE